MYVIPYHTFVIPRSETPDRIFCDQLCANGAVILRETACQSF
jgi:hypothetical protein